MTQNSNQLRILIATDNHLGFADRDNIRKDDSFRTMDEIFTLAKAQEVDFVLLGGDLFHENNPSRRTVIRSLELFKKHCLGDGRIDFQMVSDPKLNFGRENGQVNYENPNMNISLPVFAIHGNHDDPVGDGYYSAMDVLSTAGLVNYFGKINCDNQEEEIYPLLFNKGSTCVAIYGLGYIRDERLHALLSHKKLKFMRPADTAQSIFNMLCVHQNRTAHSSLSPKAYLPEDVLDELFDFVVWGHEHECLGEPVENKKGNFHVYQPGSSVAIQLSEAESKPKHVGVLTVEGTTWNLQLHALGTVRPMLLRELHVTNCDDETMIQRITQAIDAMLLEQEQEKQKQKRGSSIPDLLPLARCKVVHDGLCSVPRRKLGHLWVDKVANPGDAVAFSRRTKQLHRGGNSAESTVAATSQQRMPQPADETTIDSFVLEFMQRQCPLRLFPEVLFTQAVNDQVLKDEKHAIEDFIKTQLEEMQRFLQADQGLDPANDMALRAKIAVKKEEQTSAAGGAGLTAVRTAPPTGRRSQLVEMDSEMPVKSRALSMLKPSVGGKGKNSNSAAGAGASLSSRGSRSSLQKGLGNEKVRVKSEVVEDEVEVVEEISSTTGGRKRKVASVGEAQSRGKAKAKTQRNTNRQPTLATAWQPKKAPLDITLTDENENMLKTVGTVDWGALKQA